MCAAVAQRLHEDQSTLKVRTIANPRRTEAWPGCRRRRSPHWTIASTDRGGLLRRRTGHAVRRSAEMPTIGRKQRSEFPWRRARRQREADSSSAMPPLGPQPPDAPGPGASPPEDRVQQRRVLQQLRRTPFDPRVSSRRPAGRETLPTSRDLPMPARRRSRTN